MDRLRIAIIGAGFSGTLCAIQLTRQRWEIPLHLILIDRQPVHGLGLAYSTQSDIHLLNVPACNMSAFPDQPDHFINWLTEHALPYGPLDFVSRKIYGRYLQELIQQTQQQLPPHITLEKVTTEVIGLIRIATDQYHLILKDESPLIADAVVLALGNFAPANPRITDPIFYENARYIRNPWHDQLPAFHSDNALLIIGTGLTMVDKVLELKQQGFTGKIYALSRHGYLPQAYTEVSIQPAKHSFPLEQLLSAPPSVRAWFKIIRTLAHAQIACQQDWRSIIIALRPHIPTLWQALPIPEKKRFLRHLRALWDTHRHLIAPQISQTLAELQASGQLVVLKGRILSYQPHAHAVTVTYQLRSKMVAQSLQVGAVINCIGPDTHLNAIQDPLVTHLREQELIRLDPLGLGLEATPHYEVITHHGQILSTLLAMGPLLKGRLWESIAVPELRTQAKNIAHYFHSWGMSP